MKIHPLKAYRDRTGKTLEQIARAAGTTRSWLSRIEAGETPGIKLARRLIIACDHKLSAEDLLQIEAAE